MDRAEHLLLLLICDHTFRNNPLKMGLLEIMAFSVSFSFFFSVPS